MDDDKLPTRKMMDHRGPAWVRVAGAWYFVTICAWDKLPWLETLGRAGAPRTPPNVLRTFDEIAVAFLNHAREYHTMGKWRLSLFMVMPNHLHMLVHVPAVVDGGVRGAPTLPRMIANWKHWMVTQYGIQFQTNFFDTRMRDDAMYHEKFIYICNNPVRWGLAKTAREWPHVIAFSREDGTELTHR